MANEKVNHDITFAYKEEENSRELLPKIELKIITPYLEYPDDWLEAILDTGYDGGLLIPIELY